MLGYYALFLASGLAGKNDLEQAQADMIVDCIEDMLKPLIDTVRETNKGKKVGKKLVVWWYAKKMVFEPNKNVNIYYFQVSTVVPLASIMKFYARYFSI